MGGPENGNFPLLYVVKMSYVGGWVVQKSLKTPLHNIKMAPYRNIKSLSIILINFLASNTYYYLFLHLDIYSHIKKKLLPSNYIPTHTRIHKYAMAEKSGGAHI